MPSAGEILRSERTKRNRSLSEIAHQTCISKRYLEAIEVDRVQDLPGEFFYKSFLRQYAKALELDESMTETVIASAVPCDADDPLPMMNEVYENAQVGSSTRWNAPTGVAIGLLVAVIAGCSGLYALWQHIEAKREAQRDMVEQQAQSAPAPVTVPAAQPPPVLPQDPQVSAETAQLPSAAPPATEVAATPLPTADAQPATPPVSEPGKMNMDLSATEPTWVSLSSEGKTVFSGVLESSQTRQFSVGENAKLTTGNAAGLDVKWNGKPIGPIGPRGQVRTVIFTANTFQILPPRPKVQPAVTPDQNP